MALSIYTIAADYRTVLEAVESGEIPEDQAGDLIEQMTGELEDKLAAIIAFSRNLEAEAEAAKAAAKRISERAGAKANKAQRLRDLVLQQMTECGIRRIERPEFSAAPAKCPPAVEVLSEESVPEDWWTTKTTRALDRAAIKAALAEGADVPGCALVRRTRLAVR